MGCEYYAVPEPIMHLLTVIPLQGPRRGDIGFNPKEGLLSDNYSSIED